MASYENKNNRYGDYEELLKCFGENLPRTRIVMLSLTSMSGEWGKNNRLAKKYGYGYVDLYSALFNLDSGEIYPEYTTDGDI